MGVSVKLRRNAHIACGNQEGAGLGGGGSYPSAHHEMQTLSTINKLNITVDMPKGILLFDFHTLFNEFWPFPSCLIFTTQLIDHAYNFSSMDCLQTPI